MLKKVLMMLLAFVLVVAGTAITSKAETLSWNAVSTYTNGSAIGGATVTYQAYWSATNGSNWQALGSQGTSTSRSFNVDTTGMPRGNTVYFAVKATVSGVDSALSSSLSWSVPGGTTSVPSAPTNLRMN